MTTFTEKNFIGADRLEKDCWEFAKNLHARGLDFDLIAGITRGGAQISIYMQEVFSLLTGNTKAFATIHAQSYEGMGKAGEVAVENIDSVISRTREGSRILVVDDIFDRGRTFKAVYDRLVAALPHPATVKIAALYYKPENTQVDMVPDYYFRTFKGDDWIVLPHELSELSEAELAAKGFTMPRNDPGTE